ncbi:MAG: hypothetical protein RXR52_31585 [Paraburkholderia sp.]|jgi:hypothetical protein|uniref:DUF7940 domain-containing protein n=1 Tax=Paraburkholderia sp. TaxID=1926495 RepID=UPI00397BE56D
MTLIEEWRRCYRLYSQQINAAGVALSATYAVMYEQIRDVLPARYLAILTAVVFAGGFIARLIKQEPKNAGTETTN